MTEIKNAFYPESTDVVETIIFALQNPQSFMEWYKNLDPEEHRSLAFAIAAVMKYTSPTQR